jgi:cis-3-alkyl-4-acyloxetan-2-one decarboxylase
MVGINRALYPFDTRRDIIRPGIMMHSIDHGTGPAVVCVHGNPTWSFFYRNLVHRLKNRYRMLVPDHVGCGFSDKPGDDRYRYTLTNRIDDLQTFLERTIPDRPYRMVVHDWGGMIGLGAALQHVDRLKQLVILNTAGFLLPDSRSFHPVLRFARTWTGGLLIRYGNAFVRGTLRWGSVLKPMPAPVRAMYLAPCNTPAKRVAIQRFVQDIPLKKHDAAYDAAKYIDTNLHRLKNTPKLIVWGKRDFIFDDAFLDEWRRRFPDAQVEVIENAGHLVLEDAPDTACDLIDRFFSDAGDLT